MLNLNHLSNSELTQTTLKLVSEERKLTTEILWHLREIELRRLHFELGYSSLFEYVRSLGYSEGAAGRRIAAMRLLKEIPEIESALNDGKLSLSTLSSVQHFLKREESQGKPKTTPEQKRELLQTMEGKSRREVDQVLAALSPSAQIPRDQEKVLTPHQVQIQFVASPELIEKLKRLKDLLAHKNPNPTYAELFDALAVLALKKFDPEKQKSRKTQKYPSMPSTEAPSFTQNTPSPPNSLSTPPAEWKRRPHIPTAIRREVWTRDQGRCTYQDPKTGKFCHSRFALEVDHIRPVGQGGSNGIENLRLLCRSHNQQRAIQIYGVQKMEKFILL